MLHAFSSLADCFNQNQPFRKILLERPPEFQIVWIQIRPDFLSGSDLGPNCLQNFSEDDTTVVLHLKWSTFISF